MKLFLTIILFFIFSQDAEATNERMRALLGVKKLEARYTIACKWHNTYIFGHKKIYDYSFYDNGQVLEIVNLDGTREIFTNVPCHIKVPKETSLR